MATGALPGWEEAPLPRWLVIPLLACLYIGPKAAVVMIGLSTSASPYVRPIVRGKQDKSVEFGSKLRKPTDEGVARVDHLRSDAFHEEQKLKTQVEAYRTRYGYYREAVLGDPVCRDPWVDRSTTRDPPSHGPSWHTDNYFDRFRNISPIG